VSGSLRPTRSGNCAPDVNGELETMIKSLQTTAYCQHESI
jgi:hypothetical protein